MPVSLPDRIEGDGTSVLPLVTREPFRLKGWHVLAMLVSFFLVVAGVNSIMLTVALRTMPGLDARNGYDASQNFNRDVIARAEAQAQRGWQSEARLTLRGGLLALDVTFRDRAGRGIEALEVSVQLSHPAQRRLDRVVTLADLGGGQYRAELKGFEPGAWGVVIEARDKAPSSETLFLSRHRLLLRDERP
jgi:nitrogen fixation protein FixH